MNAHYIIIEISLLIIISYLCGIFAKRTHIPVVLLLMGIGIAINYFSPVNTGNLTKTLELLGTIGLIMIVLEAVMDLKITKGKGLLIWRSCMLALLLLLTTSSFIACLFHLWMDMPYYTALVYSVPFSVMSSAVVIPSTGGLAEKKKEFMVLESSFSDIFGIMIFYFLVDLRDYESLQAISIKIISNITLTIALSLVASFILIILFQRIKSEVKLFLLIASLLVLYSTGKLMHLSSLVTILTFGLVLNNHQLFFRGPFKQMVLPQQIKNIRQNFRVITMETAFVVRTFFFILFGMSIVPDQLSNPATLKITGVIISGVYILRYSGLRIFCGKGKEICPEVFITPRGLITILLFYAIPDELRVGYFNEGILFALIISTSLIMTFSLIIFRADAQAAPSDTPPTVPHKK